MLIFSLRSRVNSKLWVSRLSKALILGDSSHKRKKSPLCSKVCIHIVKMFPVGELIHN